MTDFADMTEDNYSKIRAILADGGKLYVASAIFTKLRETALKLGAWQLVDALVPSDYLEPGTIVAMMPDAHLRLAEAGSTEVGSHG